MELLDRLPLRDRRSVVVVIVLGAISLLAASLLVWQTWVDEDEGPAAQEPAELVRVVAQRGGFAVAVPSKLTGTSLEKGRVVRFAAPNRRVVVTVGPSGRAGLEAGHLREVAGIRGAYPVVRVDRHLATTWAGHAALRSVGSVRRDRGDSLVFSVTTMAQGKRTWSAVMFADARVKPGALAKWYQPVLDGFGVLP